MLGSQCPFGHSFASQSSHPHPRRHLASRYSTRRIECPHRNRNASLRSHLHRLGAATRWPTGLVLLAFSDSARPRREPRYRASHLAKRWCRPPSTDAADGTGRGQMRGGRSRSLGPQGPNEGRPTKQMPPPRHVGNWRAWRRA
jgi:hypothetical protein